MNNLKDLSADDYRNLLQSLIDNGNISLTAVENIKEMTKQKIKNAIVEKLGKEPKVYVHTDKKRVFTKIKVAGKWKNIYGNSEDELFSNVYDFLYGDTNITLADLFPRFMLYRRDIKKMAYGTLVDDKRKWNKFLKDNKIVNIPMRNLKVKDFIMFFQEITKDSKETNKAVQCLKSLLNRMYSYAIFNDWVEYNPLKNIDMKMFNYRVPNNSDKVYTIENRNRLLSYLKPVDDEPYSLAIQLAFQITIRVGELKALCWSDINFDEKTISINKQVLRERNMKDDLTFEHCEDNLVEWTKGRHENGKRVLPMTSEAVRILRLAKEINPHGKFVFMPFGKPILTLTFNDYLKRYCKKAGVPYLSSHKIRFTTCSMLYSSGDIGISTVSRAMGHSETRTTVHYLRSIHNADDLRDSMENAFKFEPQ